MFFVGCNFSCFKKGFVKKNSWYPGLPGTKVPAKSLIKKLGLGSRGQKSPQYKKLHPLFINFSVFIKGVYYFF